MKYRFKKLQLFQLLSPIVVIWLFPLVRGVSADSVWAVPIVVTYILALMVTIIWSGLGFAYESYSSCWEEDDGA